MNQAEELSVLIKATERVCTILKLNEKSHLLILIQSINTKLKHQRNDNNSNQNEVALAKQTLITLVSFYRALHDFCGGDTAFMNHWLDVTNKSFGAPPRELLSSCEGIQRLSRYFDELNAIKR